MLQEPSVWLRSPHNWSPLFKSCGCPSTFGPPRHCSVDFKMDINSQNQMDLPLDISNRLHESQYDCLLSWKVFVDSSTYEMSNVLYCKWFPSLSSFQKCLKVLTIQKYKVCINHLWHNHYDWKNIHLSLWEDVPK